MSQFTPETPEPRTDHLLVSIEGLGKSSGGLILPSSAAMEDRIGRVVKCGPGLFQAITDFQDLAERHTWAAEMEKKGNPIHDEDWYGWRVPVPLERGDLVLFDREHPDAIEVGAGLFLVREYLVQAKIIEAGT